VNTPTSPRLARGLSRLQYTHAERQGAARLTVPASIARLIGRDATFQAELTEDGILFRYVDGQAPVELPAWMRGE